MNDYYDRLEQQLMDATGRPWPRTLRGPSARWGPRRDLLALAAGLAVAAAVVAIFISVRPAARPAKHASPPAATRGRAQLRQSSPAPARRRLLLRDQARPRAGRSVEGANPLELLPNRQYAGPRAEGSRSQGHGGGQRQAAVGHRLLDRRLRPHAESERWRLRGLAPIGTGLGRELLAQWLSCRPLQPGPRSATHLRRDRHPRRRRQRPAPRPRADPNPLRAAGDGLLPIRRESAGPPVEPVGRANRARRMVVVLIQTEGETPEIGARPHIELGPALPNIDQSGGVLESNRVSRGYRGMGTRCRGADLRRLGGREVGREFGASGAIARSRPWSGRGCRADRG